MDLGLRFGGLGLRFGGPGAEVPHISTLVLPIDTYDVIIWS